MIRPKTVVGNLLLSAPRMMMPLACASYLASVAGCDPGALTPDGWTTVAAPATLRATGLYADATTMKLAPGVERFEPRYPLWADGAEKTRWIWLPPGTRIDTGDMDHWSFPVGTRLWKEFRVNGVPVETRLIERYGPQRDDFLYAAYRWDPAGTDAVLVTDGVPDANRSGHDIPSSGECQACHGHLSEHVLGFSAVQLTQDGPGLNMATLSQQGRLTTPRPEGAPAPGDSLAASALGYLHGNCGHCHNPDGVRLSWPFTLRLLAGDHAVEQTGAYRTAVGVAAADAPPAGITHRITPGDPASSFIPYRMAMAGTAAQMPPFGSKHVDPAGLASVEAWISALK